MSKKQKIYKDIANKKRLNNELTHETPEKRKLIIEAKQSGNGGYTMKQLAEWGVPWPPEHGWKLQLIEYGHFFPNRFYKLKRLKKQKLD